MGSDAGGENWSDSEYIFEYLSQHNVQLDWMWSVRKRNQG